MVIRPGINIQFPISRLIHSLQKTIETRTYPIPDKYIGVELYLIETPGKVGDFQARIIGTITFGESFEYESSEQFYKEYNKHFVDKESVYCWSTKPKWGWPILKYKPLKAPITVPQKRGIRFTREISI